MTTLCVFYVNILTETYTKKQLLLWGNVEPMWGKWEHKFVEHYNYSCCCHLVKTNLKHWL